jgi:type I restriction enzyme S subunit
MSDEARNNWLPEGWTRTNLGDVFPLIYGKGLPKRSREESGSVPVYGSNGIVGYHSEALTRDETVVVGRKGTVGAVHHSPIPCWPIDTTYFLDNKRGNSLRFCYYLLRHLQLASYDRSTAIPGLNRKDYDAIEVGLPDVEQQQRIVAKIEELFSDLDAGVAALERVQANLQRYRASVLKAAVEGRLTQQWRAEHPDVEPADQLLQRILRERREKWEQDQLAKYEAKGKKPPKNWKDKYKEPAAPDTTNLPKLPARWCWATVDQLAAVQSGQTPTGIKSRLVPNGALDWFKVGDMNETSNSWYMTAAKARLSSEDADSLGLHRAPAGTIIFPKRGGAIATNKKRILAFESSYDLNTMGVTPHSAVANYFFWWFATVDFRKISDGSNVPQINHDDIAPLMFPLPPAEEQTAIVSAVERAVSSANSLLISNRGNRFRASKLRQAILQWAFEGKLINANP